MQSAVFYSHIPSNLSRNAKIKIHVLLRHRLNLVIQLIFCGENSSLSFSQDYQANLDFFLKK